MKFYTKFTLGAFLLIALFVLNGCMFETVYGSKEDVTVGFSNNGFKSVSIGSGGDLTLIKSDSYSVEISINENLKEYLEVVQENDELRISIKPMIGISNLRLSAVIKMPEINKVSLSGGSTLSVDGQFESAGEIAFSLSGGSTGSANISSKKTLLNLSGGSIFELDGKSEETKMNLSGGSIVKMSDFPIQTAEMNLSGGSIANIYINGEFVVSASGGSIVNYTGTGTLKESNLSGGSLVNKK